MGSASFAGGDQPGDDPARPGLAPRGAADEAGGQLFPTCRGADGPLKLWGDPTPVTRSMLSSTGTPLHRRLRLVRPGRRPRDARNLFIGRG